MGLFISEEYGGTTTCRPDAEQDFATGGDVQASKKADVAGPGIGDYDQPNAILPNDYNPLLPPKETQVAIFHLRRHIEDELTFLHAQELLAMYPDLPRKRRETVILQKHPAIFIIGIGWRLKDGYPHEMRATDYDDWVTDTSSQTHCDTDGLNGVWNHVTQRCHELSSMGIRVNAETLRNQLEMSNLLDSLRFPYHQGSIRNELPLSIGGGNG